MGQDVTVLTPEGEEALQHPRQIERPVIADEAAGLLRHPTLHGIGQGADDDLAVHGVRRAHRIVRCDEPQVPDIGEVVVIGAVGRELDVGGDQRLQDAAHPRLVEAGDERVEVRLAGQDQTLSRLVDMLGGDRLHGGQAELLGDLAAEGVGQPGLAAGQLPEPVEGGRFEAAAGVGGVVLIEGPELGL